MEKRSSLDAHLSEEMLEEYCFDRLSEETTVALEDHLLVCVECQVAVQDLDEYILLMKFATREISFSTETLVPKPESGELPGQENGAGLAPAYAAERGSRPFSVPRLASQRHVTAARGESLQPEAVNPHVMIGAICAAGLGLSCVLALFLLRSEPVQSAAIVPLSAFRGGGDRLVAHAPAATPLDLQADISDLPGAELPGTNTYRVEVVDVAGQPVWNQTVLALKGTLFAHQPKGLRAGVYWVRLYARSGELLREFSLRLDDPALHR